MPAKAQFELKMGAATREAFDVALESAGVEFLFPPTSKPGVRPR